MKRNRAPVSFADPEAEARVVPPVPPEAPAAKIPRLTANFSAPADPSHFAAMIQQLQQATQEKKRPPQITLNSQGELVDISTGKKVEMNEPVATLKANQNRAPVPGVVQKRPQRLKMEKAPDISKNNPYFDPSVPLAKTVRKARPFALVEPGTFKDKAEKLRKMLATRAVYRARQRSAFAKGADVANPNLIPLGDTVADASVAEKEQDVDSDLDDVPECEWWDAAILVNKSYTDLEAKPVLECVRPKKLTRFIEHPPSKAGPNSIDDTEPLALMLTKTERKKIRTQGRIAREKDRQEKIRLGLVPPPKPKVRISNLMRVLGNEATADPTAMERFVRDEVEARRAAHDARNQERKLTPDERRQKKDTKLHKDAENCPLITLFKVADLTNGQKRYKVDLNAQQFKLTGCGVLTEDFALILVEGGPKPMRKYTHLMLNRIKWDEDEITVGKEKGAKNWCRLVWQGESQIRNFVGFKMHHFAVVDKAKKYLTDLGVGHYWDLCENHKPPAEEVDEEL
eukprot:TRINITY_DN3461_c0_g1_i1.p1 TRINITY_DN3461_c0_g1~~TRINITY_DN3461_c0_g1_i1.p1  ORF type:complete len:520 (-),score=90.50 TRINITY_DN3461_c0_g1_i1:1-1539(-)